MTVIERHRFFDAPSPAVWAVVTDHERYGEVAPNLEAVEVCSGEREMLVRRCVDVDGSAWTERCTHWREGRSFAVAVDVAESPFHRRLFTRFEGEWRVEPRAAGTRVTIRFDFDPRYGPLGRLIAACLRWRARGIVDAIFDGWSAGLAGGDAGADRVTEPLAAEATEARPDA